MLTPALALRKLEFRECDRVDRSPRFHVFDGACRVVIEAQSEEDASVQRNGLGIYLCV
jgi:hypothetical protein